MKELFIALFILLTTQKGWSSDVNWVTSFKEEAPSCSLYRKRVANYYQRVQEFELANQALTESLHPMEIARLVELANRTGIPLSANEMAIWSVEVPTQDWGEKIRTSLEEVVVTSPVLNWESDKFLFPSDIMRVELASEARRLRIELLMPFPFACLQASELVIQLKFLDGSGEELRFLVDKTAWDKS